MEMGREVEDVIPGLRNQEMEAEGSGIPGYTQWYSDAEASWNNNNN